MHSLDEPNPQSEETERQMHNVKRASIAVAVVIWLIAVALVGLVILAFVNFTD